MRPLIKTCDWEITTNCNLNCKHCIIEKKYSESSTNFCLDIIDFLKERGCKEITFTGGEPLSKKGILKIMSYSKNKGMKNYIFTNGTLINRNNIKIIKKVVRYIGFSLDGFEESTNFIRGKGVFNKTMAAIKWAKDKKIPFGIYLTLNNRNVKNLKTTLKFIKDIGAHNISINELVLRGNVLKNKNIYFKINKNKILKIVEEIFRRKLRKSTGCALVPGKIFLNPAGKFYNCTEISQTDPMRNYNLSDEGLKQYYLSFKNRKKRNNHCPYEVYFAKGLSVNLINNKGCSFS